MAEKKPYEQLEGESLEAFSRFLIYRNLGPARSVDAAYAYFVSSASKNVAKSGKTRSKPKRASGQWFKDSEAFNWPARAAAWDVEMLTEVGRDAVVKFVNILDELFARILGALVNDKIAPTDWNNIVESVTILGGFVPQETVAELRRLRDASVSAPLTSASGGGIDSKPPS